MVAKLPDDIMHRFEVRLECRQSIVHIRDAVKVGWHPPFACDSRRLWSTLYSLECNAWTPQRSTTHWRASNIYDYMVFAFATNIASSFHLIRVPRYISGEPPRSQPLRLVGCPQLLCRRVLVVIALMLLGGTGEIAKHQRVLKSASLCGSATNKASAL